jgi:hypothetical protein
MPQSGGLRTLPCRLARPLCEPTPVATWSLGAEPPAELGGLPQLAGEAEERSLRLRTRTTSSRRSLRCGEPPSRAALRTDVLDQAADAGCGDRVAWKAAMAAGLEAVGPTAELMLVPGGLLRLLPLHSAWTTDTGTPTGRRHVLHVLVPSYAINARAVAVARVAAARVDGNAILPIQDPMSGQARCCAVQHARGGGRTAQTRGRSDFSDPAAWAPFAFAGA